MRNDPHYLEFLVGVAVGVASVLIIVMIVLTILKLQGG